MPIAQGEIKKAKTKSKEPFKLENLKVFVVDDEEDILRALKRFLAIHNISVLTAKNGKGAIRLLKQKEFDVILSDIKMPEINGLELGTWLETRKPGDIEKFVLFTGVIDQETDDYCSKHHCKYLLKPVDNDTILETICSVARN